MSSHVAVPWVAVRDWVGYLAAGELASLQLPLHAPY